MWVSAQRDGRPGECRWRPLLNAANWLTPTTRVPCSNVAKTRNPLKCAGVPRTRQQIQLLVGRSSPYCKDVWGRYYCLTSFFSDCRYMHQLRRYSPTKLWDGAEMAVFASFLHHVFSASNVQHISDLHSKFALRPYHVWKYGRHPISDR